MHVPRTHSTPFSPDDGQKLKEEKNKLWDEKNQMKNEQ